MAFFKFGLPVLSLLAAAAISQAVPTSYTAIWSGAEYGNSLYATATVMLDLEQLEMPGFYNDEIGFGPLTSLAMNVTGSANPGANRDYTGADFNTYAIEISLPLDVTQEWIGQPQADGFSFGEENGSSQFSFFAAEGEDTVTQCCEFTMVVLPFAEDPEDDEIMRMISFAPTNAVPEPASLAVVGLAGAALLRRRKKS
ncbi:PEP-CTERM sorting domain-containing protein [bacterium]|nr:MAG: PEP-CTERM sorting domain-containing protein [bacterium]